MCHRRGPCLQGSFLFIIWDDKTTRKHCSSSSSTLISNHQIIEMSNTAQWNQSVRGPKLVSLNLCHFYLEEMTACYSSIIFKRTAEAHEPTSARRDTRVNPRLCRLSRLQFAEHALGAKTPIRRTRPRCHKTQRSPPYKGPQTREAPLNRFSMRVCVCRRQRRLSNLHLARCTWLIQVQLLASMVPSRCPY